jgi:hypothetical protein
MTHLYILIIFAITIVIGRNFFPSEFADNVADLIAALYLIPLLIATIALYIITLPITLFRKLTAER